MNHYKNFRLIILIITFSIITQLASGATKKNVLILNAYNKTYSWADSTIKAIDDQFTNVKDVRLFYEYLDAKRFTNFSYWAPFAQTLAIKYSKTKFDVIIISDNAALDFLKQYRSKLFKNTPVVFSGINNFHPDILEGETNITGVNEQIDVKGTIELLLKIHPNLKKLIVVTSSGIGQIGNNKATKKALKELRRPKIKIEYLNNINISDIRKKQKLLDKNSVILLVGRVYDDEGNLYIPFESEKQFALESPVPIYSMWSYMMGSGITGGKMVNGHDQGKEAAKMAIKILNGSSTRDIPVLIESPTSPIFDYNQLIKYNIPLANLPDDSIIYYKSFSFYEQYKILVWVSISVFTILIILILLLIINTLKRRSAEKELQKAHGELELKVLKRTEQLMNAKELAEVANHAKSDFLSNMSHEIRTPMNSILGFTQVLRDLEHEPRKIEYINNIYTSGQSLLKLINDILDLSKMEARKLKLNQTATSLKYIFDEINSLFVDMTKEEGINFQMLLDPKTPEYLMIDETRIKQILINIIGNAIKFTPSGSITTTLKCSTREDSPKNMVDLTFLVSDTGIGIPEEKQEKIFNVFEQIQDNNLLTSTGTGLGLSITKLIIELMNGSISLESDLGKGTQITINLPNIEVLTTEQEQEKTKSSDDHPSFSPATIIIADDDDFNREILKDYLAEWDFQIFEVQNGKEVIKMTNEIKPDIILMDIKMPIMNGHEASKIIKSNDSTSEIPIIVITAFGLKQDEELFREYCDDFIRKPFNKKELVRILTKFLN